MFRIASFAAVVLISMTAGCQSQPAYVAVPPPPPKSASVEQRGYQEGYRMGAKDVQYGRRFEIARHTPYQSPPVPQEDWNEYRDAYSHGYRAAYGREPLRQLEPMPPASQPVPPAQPAEVQERAYQDGYRMGIADVQQGKEFAIARHAEFRYPPVAPAQADLYRSSYQYGYRVAYGMEPPPDQEPAPASQPQAPQQ